MSYLAKIETLPEGARWPQLRGWMKTEPLPLFAELRAHRPVLVLPELTLVTRHSDCVDILARHDLYSVAPYAPKQGSYWMAQDDTARHWREKSIMRALLDRERIPEMRAWAEAEAARLLSESCDAVDAVKTLTRGVPIAFVQHWFGFEDADPEALLKWSYWNQMDAFWNQPFDAPAFATADEIVTSREASNDEMRGYLVGLFQKKGAQLQAGGAPTDMISRLIVMARAGVLEFNAELAVLNAGGLLIGAVETTSHAAVNAARVICEDPARLEAARAAARSGDERAFDGFVFEALRFRPAFPYFFRIAEDDTVLARGTDHETAIPRGAMVLAVTHSAMFDPTAVSAPETFDPRRRLQDTFTFGYGVHECLGRAVGAALIPAIVKALLLDETRSPCDVDYRKGPVPEAWRWQPV